MMNMSRERRIGRAYFIAVVAEVCANDWHRSRFATYIAEFLATAKHDTHTHTPEIQENNIHLGCWQLHQRLRRQTKRVMCIYCSALHSGCSGAHVAASKITHSNDNKMMHHAYLSPFSAHLMQSWQQSKGRTLQFPLS